MTRVIIGTGDVDGVPYESVVSYEEKMSDHLHAEYCEKITEVLRNIGAVNIQIEDKEIKKDPS